MYIQFKRTKRGRMWNSSAVVHTSEVVKEKGPRRESCTYYYCSHMGGEEEATLSRVGSMGITDSTFSLFLLALLFTSISYMGTGARRLSRKRCLAIREEYKHSCCQFSGRERQKTSRRRGHKIHKMIRISYVAAWDFFSAGLTCLGL